MYSKVLLHVTCNTISRFSREFGKTGASINFSKTALAIPVFLDDPGNLEYREEIE
jgi:hypothetical protein